MELKKIDKWYVDNEGMPMSQCHQRDSWCMKTFDAYRHDTELDEGWWLQSEEEYTLFVLTWGGK